MAKIVLETVEHGSMNSFSGTSEELTKMLLEATAAYFRQSLNADANLDDFAKFYTGALLELMKQQDTVVIERKREQKTAKKLLKCIKLEGGNEPFLSEIADDLAALQAHVGGHIEAVTTASGLVVIVNEEGRLTPGLPLNGGLPSLDGRLPTPIIGNALVLRSDGEDFASVVDEDLFTVLKAWEGLANG